MTSYMPARTRKFSKFSKTSYMAAEQGISLENNVKPYFFACGAPQNTFFLNFCISTKFFISDDSFYTIFLLKNLKINMVFIKNTWFGASYMPAESTKFSKFSASVIYTDRHICPLPPVRVAPHNTLPNSSKIWFFFVILSFEPFKLIVRFSKCDFWNLWKISD